MINNWQVIVLDRDGTPLGEIVNFVSLSFTTKLNNVGNAVIKVPLNDPTLSGLIAQRRYQVQIKRDGVLLWAGEQVNLRADIKDESQGTNFIDIFCNDYIELFNARRTALSQTYSSTDAGAIAWDLIDTSQSLTDGDFGITQGTIETTVSRDRSYFNQNIMEAIINLSKVVNGFDFEITPNKVFNVYARKGQDKSSTAVFQYGVNFKSFGFDSDFGSPCNEARAVGEGFGPNRLNTTSVNTGSRSSIGLRQQVTIEEDVSVLSTLQDKSDELVNDRSVPINTINFVQAQTTNPRLGTLVTGDVVRIRAEVGIIDVDNVYRIYGINIKVDQRGNERIEYVVNTQ